MTRARIGNGLLLAVLAALMLALALWQREPWWNGAADIPRITMAALMLTAWLAIAVVFLRPQRREAPSASDDALLILWASQTGFAAQLARHSAQSLNEAGIDTLVLPLEAATPARLQRHARALVIASTTGEGDPPDHALGFVPALQGAQIAALDLRIFQVVAARSQGDDARNVGHFERTIDPGTAMALGRQAHPVGVIVKVDQADGLRQIAEQCRGQVVIVAGTDKEQFRPVRRARRSFFQLLHESPVGALGGP